VVSALLCIVFFYWSARFTSLFFFVIPRTHFFICLHKKVLQLYPLRASLSIGTEEFSPNTAKP